VKWTSILKRLILKKYASSFALLSIWYTILVCRKRSVNNLYSHLQETGSLPNKEPWRVMVKWGRDENPEIIKLKPLFKNPTTAQHAFFH
jgi:hypothetical protein